MKLVGNENWDFDIIFDDNLKEQRPKDKIRMYRQALANLSNINLDMVLDEMGYEKSGMVSFYGMNDYPNLEKSGDIQLLSELINKYEELIRG